nr:RNA-directed DNA polymerase, eukaryota, reverse transcriptase zinc-binding domain protein [Tanacetum cinerariifolium]
MAIVVRFVDRNRKSKAGVGDISLGGYSFTWAHKSASKMSKLDRFLIFEGLMELFPYLTGLCLDRHLSDHRPIIMFETKLDYGPIPFRMFRFWFKLKGFNNFVKDTWNSLQMTDSNTLIRMKKKLQLLKYTIKDWVMKSKKTRNEPKFTIKSKLHEVDKVLDRGGGDDEVIQYRTSLMKDLDAIISDEALDFSQKAKIRRSIEGDENSKYYYRILNSKRSQLAIRGILFMVIGLLIRAKKYWNIIGQDIVITVSQFFASSKFPPGCNSIFIALISKIHDAKVVKDFRPISLIRSIYKIIAKILANQLSAIISDLISEVQTAFVSNRQILDGPFILNELISWCKNKKVKAMIFKVDFEKAFYSVRWDYLDDVLKSFGFGVKWRSWISECLNSAKGSILINGIPTPEFQFHKGLKQRDPLSLFLFILVIKSLHRSFSRVIDAGEWNISNINTILNVLKCFFMALGFKVNLHKSKLSGIGISKEHTDLVASIKDVIDKISFRLLKWKTKTLSNGGRLTLLKSVLTSLPLYYMSIYKAPTTVIKDLEAMRRDFFIGSNKVDRKMVWIRWDITLASKKMVGLEFQVSMLPTELFYSNVYGDLSFNVLPFGQISSKLYMVSKEDTWLGESSLKMTHPRLFALKTDKGIKVANKLGHTSLACSFCRIPRSGVEEEQYKNLKSITSNVILPHMQDRWFWSLKGSGDFNVKSVRNYIDEILLPKLDAPTRGFIEFVLELLRLSVTLDTKKSLNANDISLDLDSDPGLKNVSLLLESGRGLQRKPRSHECSDIGEQEKKAKLFNEWEKFTSTDGESIESYYHCFMQLMNDLKRNKHFPENIAANLKFLNKLQPEWKRHVTIVRQTKNLHKADFTQIYDFLKMNQDEISYNFPATQNDQSSSNTYSQQSFPINNKYKPQPSLNQNFMQPPMTSLEDINDPTEAMNAALILFAKAFQLTAPTNKDQRTSSNLRNRQITQPGMNMSQDRQIQNVGGKGG